MMLKKLLKVDVSGIIFTLIKQFGTGVIIATGFVHVSNGKSRMEIHTDHK
jgi:hypothetical protein